MAQSFPRGVKTTFEALVPEEKQKLQRMVALMQWRNRCSWMWLFVASYCSLVAFALMTFAAGDETIVRWGVTSGAAVLGALAGCMVKIMVRRRIRAEFNRLKADPAAQLGIGNLKIFQPLIPAMRDYCELEWMLAEREVKEFFPPRPQQRR